jgi:hypothetical protein
MSSTASAPFGRREGAKRSLTITGQVGLGRILSLRVATPPVRFDMTVSGASAAGSHLASQQAQSITQQHKRVRHPSVSEVQMQGANGAAMSGPTSNGKAGHRVDITA